MSYQQPPARSRSVSTAAWIVIAVFAVCVGLPLAGCLFWGGWAYLDGAFK